MKRNIALACVLLGSQACGNEPLMEVQDDADRAARTPDEGTQAPDDPTLLPREREDEPTRATLPLGCGEPVFPEVSNPLDIIAWGDALAVSGANGVWRFEGAQAEQLDPRGSWRLRLDGDALAFLTPEPSVNRIDAAGVTTELLRPDTHVTDFVLRGNEVWTTEELYGRVIATDRSTGARRQLISGADADWMLMEQDAVFVAIPPTIIKLDPDGNPSLAYRALESTNVFYAVSRLASDATSLYFTTYIDGGLARVDRETGQYQVIEYSRDHHIPDVAVHGERLYWIESDFAEYGRSRVMRSGLDGEDAGVFLDEACVHDASSLRVLGDTLYVLQGGGTMRVPLTP
jgi:hypothetical protein